MDRISLFHCAASTESLRTAQLVFRCSKPIRTDSPHNRFATLFYVILDSKKRELRYSNAAHWPLLVYRAKKDDFVNLDTDGLPIGVKIKTHFG